MCWKLELHVNHKQDLQRELSIWSMNFVEIRNYPLFKQKELQRWRPPKDELYTRRPNHSFDRLPKPSIL